MKTTTKHTWSVEQKINFVKGFTNCGITKTAYCEQNGLNRDIFHRWEKAYENGTLVANGKKSVAKKTTAPKQTKAKTKVSAKKATTKKQTTKKTAKAVVKASSVKTKKSFSFWTRKADKKTIQSLCAENEHYADQLKDSRLENTNLREKTRDLEKQIAYLQSVVDRMTWSA